jgi:hypothetical protein
MAKASKSLDEVTAPYMRIYGAGQEQVLRRQFSL